MDPQQILQFPQAAGGEIRCLQDAAFRKGFAT
jgi:hypothetical protein